MLGIGRTAVYQLMSAGRLDGRKLGRRTVITAESMRHVIAQAPRADIHLGRQAAAQ